MLRIDRTAKNLKRLDIKAIPEAGLKERDDIQQMIRNSPDAFFDELGERLLLIGEEVRPSTEVDDRIDLLAIDDKGSAVIVELKRGTHKLQLLQALAYAAMIAREWDRDRFIAERAKLTGKTNEAAEEDLEDFLSVTIEELNEQQRVMLLAEKFDYEVLATAEWLNEGHGVDIRCYRLELCADGSGEFLACTCIYPPAELAQQAVRRRNLTGSRPLPWANWDEALEEIDNAAIATFFRQELEAGREARLPKRELIYRLHGVRRFYVGARKKAAYVWQAGRFQGDEEFWGSTIGSHAKATQVNQGRSLRFYLTSESDFAQFKTAFNEKLNAAIFTELEAASEGPEDDAE